MPKRVSVTDKTDSREPHNGLLYCYEGINFTGEKDVPRRNSTTRSFLPESKLKIPASEQIRRGIDAMLKVMRFVISYKKKPPSNDPEHQILISVFYVERDEKPSMEEVLKIVEKHSGDDFIPDSIEVKEGYV